MRVLYKLMGRRKVSLGPDGTISCRIAVPNDIWTVLVSVGQLQADRLSIKVNAQGAAGQIGLAVLMRHVCDLIADGDVAWLPERDFGKAIASLKAANFGTVAPSGAEIDIAKLHTSRKLKSGYEGVYASNQGFRAVSHDFAGKAIVIGTYKTAEEAAHRRLIYHRVNNLAYGELETEMRTWRKNPQHWSISPEISDEQLIAQIKKHCEIVHTYDMIFGPGTVTVEPVFSSKLPKREDVVAKLATRTPKQLAAPKETSHTKARANAMIENDLLPARLAAPKSEPIPTDPADARHPSYGDAEDEPTHEEREQIASGGAAPYTPTPPPGFDPDDIPPEWG